MIILHGKKMMIKDKKSSLKTFYKTIFQNKNVLSNTKYDKHIVSRNPYSQAFTIKFHERSLLITINMV